MSELKRLCDIEPGECTRVTAVRARDEIRRRLFEIGFIEDTPVECVGRSPLGDPSAYLIRGTVIALRREDSREVLVST